MNQDPKPEKLNDPDPAEGQPEHPEYHRGRSHEAIERDSELAALRAERDALRLQLGRTGKELTLASDRAERAESDAAALKDQRTKLHVKLIALLHRFGAGETEEQDGENIAAMVERLASDAAESKRRCGELEQAMSAAVEAIRNMRTGISVHNSLHQDAPARRDDIRGPVVDALAEAQATLAAALTPEASK